MSLGEILADIALNYEIAKNQKIAKHEIAIALRHGVPNALRTILKNNKNILKDKKVDIYVNGSAGIGRWAEVPWCAIFNTAITKSAKKGYFVVYLFNAKDKKIYLSLNQGTNSVKEKSDESYIDVLNERAAEYREKLTEFEGIIPLTEIKDFYGENATGYAAGHILGFEYDASNMPDDDTLIRDLQNVLEAYSVLFPKSPTPLFPTKPATVEAGSFDYKADDNLTATKNDDDEDEDEEQFIKEKRTYRYHRRIERSSQYAKEVKKVHGLQCECCNLDFGKLYGEIGKGFIEVHHMIPLSSLTPESDKAYNIKKDFAVLCPNCHRMIHRLPDPSDLETLKKLTKFKFPKESSKAR